MKTIVVILILLAFIQTSIWPLNLGLILILVRSFIRADRVNLFLAFSFGLLLSHLQNLPLGRESLIFCILVGGCYLWSERAFAKNIWSMTAFIVLMLAVVRLISSTTLMPDLLIETILILPIYLAVRFWEERFIVKHEIKLKI